jgi:hypothetical protein
MFAQAREWLKVYLFYGILFFSVGFVGYLLNNNAAGLNDSVGYFRKILTDIPVVKELERWRSEREIPVFSNFSEPVVFFVYPADEQSGEFFRMRKAELENHFKQVTAVPVTEAGEWDQQLASLSSGSGDHILIGMKTTVITGKNAKNIIGQNHLFLNLPDRFWPSFFQQSILSLSSRLPSITIRQHTQGDCPIFEFIYEESAGSGKDDQAFNCLIDILEKMEISGRRVLE